MYQYEVPTCTATKIGPRHLVTAGRCLLGGAKDIGIAFGSPAQELPGLEIERVSGHVSYFSHYFEYANDIALILTNQPLPGSDVVVGVADEIANNLSSELLIAGYGEHVTNPWRFGPIYVEIALQKLRLLTVNCARDG